jgi:hypothetical protein
VNLSPHRVFGSVEKTSQRIIVVITVKYRLHIEDLAIEMARMRRWLDHRKITVDSFEFKRSYPGIIIVEVYFYNREESDEFANEFCKDMVVVE